MIHEIIVGWLERIVELAGGRNPRVEITARSWADDPHTAYRVSCTEG